MLGSTVDAAPVAGHVELAVELIREALNEVPAADPARECELLKRLGEAVDTVGSRQAYAKTGRLPADQPPSPVAAPGDCGPGAGRGAGRLVLARAQLFGQRLNADPVVMSACRTGTRATSCSGWDACCWPPGSRSALVTLWAINDVSAALLMAEFHHLRGPIEPMRSRCNGRSAVSAR